MAFSFSAAKEDSTDLMGERVGEGKGNCVRLGPGPNELCVIIRREAHSHTRTNDHGATTVNVLNLEAGVVIAAIVQVPFHVKPIGSLLALPTSGLEYSCLPHDTELDVLLRTSYGATRTAASKQDLPWACHEGYTSLSPLHCLSFFATRQIFSVSKEEMATFGTVVVVMEESVM